MVTMYITYKYVEDIEAKAEVYSFRRLSDRSTNNSRRSKLILRQGLLYALALFLVWLFPLIYMCMLIANKVSYIIFILMSLFGPLQGVWNLLIY